MAKRKVIQLVTMPASSNVLCEATVPAALYALCEDGTMWGRNAGHGWRKVENVPDSPPERPLSAPSRRIR